MCHGDGRGRIVGFGGTRRQQGNDVDDEADRRKVLHERRCQEPGAAALRKPGVRRVEVKEASQPIDRQSKRVQLPVPPYTLAIV